MSLVLELRNLIAVGIHRIGEIELLADFSGQPYVLCHYADLELCKLPEFGDLKLHRGPAAARAISTYAADGDYRFTKGEISLQRGWVMTLADAEELRLALDQFYPACAGLFLAWQQGTLEIETLRDKLNRQTGMYRFARSISDAGAQKLITEVCGPAHRCAKKILWQLDPETPLDDSEASRYNGILGSLTQREAIPLLCREACNHFVAECRKAAKAEFEARQ
jgi:4Fe-4S iron-sulfur cluster binding domain/DR2241 stabilising domain